MDLYDLLERLKSERIDPAAVSIGYPLREQTYCLEKRGNRWAVFFVERGEHASEAIFDEEADACLNLLLRVLEDSTTRAQ